MGVVIVLAGESGSGKTTVALELEKQLGLKNIVSFTTREPRYKNEKGHIFVNEELYKLDKESGIIAAETYFNNSYYWTTKDQLEENCIYVVDKKGIEYLRENCPDKKIIVIYLRCSKKNRFIRMVSRGEGKEKALERIEHDEEAFKGLETDHIVNANQLLKFVIEDTKKILDKVLR